MKVIGIVCSPRIGGNTEILVNEALNGAREEGAKVELITTAEKEINFCDGCGACEESGQCKIKDDMQEIYEKLIEADGIIFGTPVYFLNVSAQAKAIIDRTYAFLRVRRLRGKVAAAIAAVRRIGGGNVLSYLYTFFIAQRMIVAGGMMGYGKEKGEVRQGPGIYKTAMEEARALGRIVVKLIRKISSD